MHIVVLGNAESWYSRDLERVATERRHRFTLVEFAHLSAPFGGETSRLAAGELDLTNVDAVIVRTMPPGSLEQIVFRMDALAQLEATGVPVLNPPKAIECAVDKYLTTSRLEAACLVVPETVVCETSEAALTAFDWLGGDVVVKPIFGSEGRGIVRVSDPELARRTFRTLERIQSVLYIQRYIAHDGFDIRILVLDGHVLGGIKRLCRHDFRANVSQAGVAEPFSLSETERDCALRAAKATGCRFAGIDLLYDQDGQCYTIEVNAVPGWRAFHRVTGCDVAQYVIESLENTTRRHEAM